MSDFDVERAELARSKGMSPGDLVGAHEIADRLGVSVTTVHKWRQRYDSFPEPYVVLAVGPVFYWPDVQVWHDTSGPRAYTRSE